MNRSSELADHRSDGVILQSSPPKFVGYGSFVRTDNTWSVPDGILKPAWTPPLNLSSDQGKRRRQMSSTTNDAEPDSKSSDPQGYVDRSRSATSSFLCDICLFVASGWRSTQRGMEISGCRLMRVVFRQDEAGMRTGRKHRSGTDPNHHVGCTPSSR